jgi:hypothetical protein
VWTVACSNTLFLISVLSAYARGFAGSSLETSLRNTFGRCEIRARYLAAKLPANHCLTPFGSFLFSYQRLICAYTCIHPFFFFARRPDKSLRVQGGEIEAGKINIYWTYEEESVLM